MTDKFFLTDSFEKHARNDFLIAGDLVLSYRETFNLIKQSIPIVQNLSTGKNRLVAVIASPSVHTIINMFALMFSGNIAVLVSDKEPESNVVEMLRTIGCSCILDKQSIPAVDEINFYNNLSLERDATVLFSSGSTTKPKGIVHSYANHYYSAVGSNENILLDKNDKWLLSLPLYHVSGVSILFRSLLAGSSVVIPEKQISLSENIDNFQISHLSLVESQLRDLVDSESEYKSLKSVLVGGSKISRSLVKKAVKRKIPIRTTYGSTEMASQITTSRENDVPDKLDTSGSILAHRELRVADDGEILVKGKTLCRKYLNSEMPVDSDGWFHTADIGYLSSDGYLTVIGRKDNMFISGGENIYPEEIEAILANSNLFSTVIVVEKVDEKFGNIPVLFYSSENELSLETIHTYLADKLPKFKYPKKIYKLPKDYNPTGIKVDRNFLREWVKENY